MRSVRGIGARVAVPSMILTALIGGLVAGPGVGPALADGSGSVQPPDPTGSGSSSGSTYTSTIGGNWSSGGGGGTTWTPPTCWVQPYFPESQTWQSGDPSSQVTDAADYYSWFVGQGAPAAVPVPRMTSEFENIQTSKTAPAGWTGPNPIKTGDIWWAPNWVDSSAGYACAQGLAAKDQLSNGYIGLEPPLKKGQQSPLTGALSFVYLSEIARAKIKLPTISIVTSPAGTQTQSAVVNTPTYVAINYAGGTGGMDPSATQTATLDFGAAPATIWASVQATITSVTVKPGGPVSATTGFGDKDQTCAAVNGQATSACSVTFSAPSDTNAPDNLTVSVTWKVTWSTSAGNGGTFPNTPPQQQTQSVIVNEIQSQN